MKKYYKSIIIVMILIITGVVSYIYIQNKSIENQPRKSKLVMDMGERMDERYQNRNIFTA